MKIPTEPIGSSSRSLMQSEAMAAADSANPRLEPLCAAAVRAELRPGL